MDTSLQDWLSHLQKYLRKNQISVNPEDCLPYGSDHSRRLSIPLAVCFPESHNDVCDILRACDLFHIPVIARGYGSSSTGAVSVVTSVVVISMLRMQRVLSVDAKNRSISVEAGISNQVVQEFVAQHGLYWPPDPGSQMYSSVGGNLAVHASGPGAVKYGNTRDYVMALRVVDAKGNTLCTGHRTHKSAAGLDLTRLLIGSEGSLAIITEATLRLMPKPECMATLQISAPDNATAMSVVQHAVQHWPLPAAVEFLDEATLSLLRTHAPHEVPDQARALLWLKIDSPCSRLSEDVQHWERYLKDAFPHIHIKSATDEKMQQALWQVRRTLAPLLRTLKDTKINEDVAVPLSRLHELMQGLEKLQGDFTDMLVLTFGHAGSGNLHVNLLFNRDEVSVTRAQKAKEALFALTMSLDGCLSGEHGLGADKAPFFERYESETSKHWMRMIKKTLDPKGLLNPGKWL